MSDPAWHREPLVLAVANALIDRLERGPQERIRAPRLRLDAQTIPGLFASDARESDYQWSLIEKMRAAAWIRLIVEGVDESEPGYYRNPRAELLDENALRQLTSRPANPPPSWHERFLAALGSLLPSGHPALQEAVTSTLPLQAYDPAIVAQQLLRVREIADTPLLLREVASQLFFAQSKALNGKESLIAAILGQPECPFPESPIQLLVHLPGAPFDRVLFVENLTPFEVLIRRHPASTKTVALVYASGYRSSAKRLRAADGASVYLSAGTRSSEGDRFCAWLLRTGPEVPVAFYGDLDFSGMDIIARLRSTFTGITAWQPGYEPMLSLLMRGGGHSPEAAGKERQRDPGRVGCEYADSVLLPALHQYGRFVDQELYGL